MCLCQFTSQTQPGALRGSRGLSFPLHAAGSPQGRGQGRDPAASCCVWSCQFAPGLRKEEASPLPGRWSAPPWALQATWTAGSFQLSSETILFRPAPISASRGARAVRKGTALIREKLFGRPNQQGNSRPRVAQGSSGFFVAAPFTHAHEVSRLRE